MRAAAIPWSSSFGAAVVMASCLSTATRAQPVRDGPSTIGNVMRGWETLQDKKCVDCHAIWGQGGRVGPDLGRIRTERVSTGQLAGVMWNHIPKMLGRMQETGRPPVSLSREEMADLFALMFFVRQLDELGTPARGEQILRDKGCTECHSMDLSDDGVGPDLAKWGKYANPVVWAQMMWEHAPLMEEAMLRSDMTWPKLEGSDLVHIAAFVRSAGVSGEKTYLSPGSVSSGRQLFREKNCNACHPGDGPDLAQEDLPRSVAALASRMWNHSPAMTKVMRERDVERSPMTPQELADILAYVLALGHEDRGGDASRGARVFAKKKCGECHDREEVAGAVAPAVARLGDAATPVDMATAMWNHGATMLEELTEAGLSWPVFGDSEMVDLLAYLRTLASDGAAAPKAEPLGTSKGN